MTCLSKVGRKTWNPRLPIDEATALIWLPSNHVTSDGGEGQERDRKVSGMGQVKRPA